MGNDGGSIPTRRELVKSPTRHPTHSQVRDSAAQTQVYRWTTCQLSKRPLSTPVVSDALGRIYNKDSVLEWLLRGAEAFGDGEEVLDGRIKSLRDVVEVKFEALEDDPKRNGNGSVGPRWMCPVSKKELGPGMKAVYLVPCGHSFAASAVKEIGDGQSGCLVCGEPYEETNAIPINPIEPREIDALLDRAKKLAEDGLTHSLKKSSEKKSKKRKKSPGDAEASGKTSKEASIKNTATASLTNKVLGQEKEEQKRRKLQMSDNVRSLFSENKGEKKTGKNNDFMSRGYTLPASVQR